MAIKVGGTTVVDDSRNICSVITVNATTVCATTLKGEGANITGIAGTVPIGGIMLATAQPCNYVKADSTIYQKAAYTCLASCLGERVDFQASTVTPKSPVNQGGQFTPDCMICWAMPYLCCPDLHNLVAASYTMYNCCGHAVSDFGSPDCSNYCARIHYKTANACGAFSTSCATSIGSTYCFGSGGTYIQGGPGYGQSPCCNKVYMMSQHCYSNNYWMDFGFWDSTTCCLCVIAKCCRCDQIVTYERGIGWSQLVGGTLQYRPQTPFWIFHHCNYGQTSSPCRFWASIASNSALSYSGMTLGINECYIGDSSTPACTGVNLCQLTTFGYNAILIGGQTNCQMVIPFYTANSNPCFCCSICTATCNFTAHDYNGNGCVFVGLRCNNLVYSADGISWTTACCCTCLSFTGAAFLTTSDNKTVLYGDFNRAYCTAGNVSFLYSCNGCNWNLITKCVGRSITHGILHEFPGSNVIGNHNILVDNAFSCITLQYPWEHLPSQCCSGAGNYYGHGRCVVYAYGPQCYISFSCKSRDSCNSYNNSVYGSATGNGWCYIGELPSQPYGDSFKLIQSTCKVVGVSHYFANANVHLLCANLGTTPLSWTCVDTKIRPQSQFGFYGGPIQIFSNKPGTSVGFAIACSCSCCSSLVQPIMRLTANALIHYTKNFGTTICCIASACNCCVYQCLNAVTQCLWIPNMYNYGNVVSSYYVVPIADSPPYSIPDTVHYCFNATDDLVFAGYNCGCTMCGSEGICCPYPAFPVLNTNGGNYYLKGIFNTNCVITNSRPHYDECTDNHYVYAINGCCVIIAATKDGTWVGNNSTLACNPSSASGGVSNCAIYCCWPTISRYTSQGDTFPESTQCYCGSSCNHRISFTVDCLNRYTTRYGAMCACFDTSLCFAVPNLNLSSTISTYIRAC